MTGSTTSCRRGIRQRLGTKRTHAIVPLSIGLRRLLAVFCILGNRLCAYVYGPSDQDESIRLMYPDGLKLSVPQTLKSAIAVSRLRWWYLKCREVLEVSQRRLKRERFQ